MSCPFCNPDDAAIVVAVGAVYARRDAHPVTDSHHLIIPTRHIPDVFAMNRCEWEGVGVLLRRLRLELERRDPTIAGFNVGANCGIDAGQTIMHAHIHLIPRRAGDTELPRGGVRGVIPEKMSY